MDDSSYLATCEIHGKRLFETRKGARRHARRAHPGAHLSAYPCRETGMWHFGHLPYPVVCGEAGRETINNRVYPID